MSKLVANHLGLNEYDHYGYYDPNKVQITNSKVVVDCPNITSKISISYMEFLSMYVSISNPNQNNLLVFAPFDSLL